MSDEPKTTLNNEHGKNAESKPKATQNSKTPKNNDETRTLSSQFPSVGFDVLDELSNQLHLDRAATIRWCLNFTLRRVVKADGHISIDNADKAFVPHAALVDWCMFGVPGF